MNCYQLTNITRFIEILAVITFVLLLGASLLCLYNFYLCDSQTCKAFEVAEENATPGSKAYTIALLNELFDDGIWFMPFIGSAIATPLTLWFLGVPITILTFAVMFFVVFATMYFILSFIIHHYVDPIRNYVINYIDASCPAT